MKNYKCYRAFTLIEVLVAISLLVVALLAAISLLIRTISLSSVITDKFIAANLAQEGVELVRNLRDNNLLNGRTWNYNLSAGKYYLDLDDKDLTKCSNGCPYLKFDKTTGFYSYNSGLSSKFKRAIIINYPTADEMQINSIVEWREKGIDFKIDVEDHLYNFY